MNSTAIAEGLRPTWSSRLSSRSSKCRRLDSPVSASLNASSRRRRLAACSDPANDFARRPVRESTATQINAIAITKAPNASASSTSLASTAWGGMAPASTSASAGDASGTVFKACSPSSWPSSHATANIATPDDCCETDQRNSARRGPFSSSSPSQ